MPSWPSTLSAPVAKPPPTNPPLPRKLRENIEAAAMAILMAVGLKYFLLEAYEIPTPSMQTTLMGSPDLGIYDRILVNKAAYLWRDPQRFDIAVFRYPHNRSQNYVKRILGLPGERLKIAGGDLYRVSPPGKLPAYEIVRKPLSLQGSLWKRVYEQSTANAASAFKIRSANGKWSVDGDVVVARDSTGRGASTVFLRADELRNHAWHGYPEYLQEKVKDLQRAGLGSGRAMVGDIRWRTAATPDDKTEAIELLLTERPEGGSARELSLRIEKRGDAATARLRARELRPNAQKVEVRSENIEWTAGGELALEFINSDDRLFARVGGTSLGPLAYTSMPRHLAQGGVQLRLTAEGGTTRFAETTVDRDMCYLPWDEDPDFVFEVPADHLWMLGDNPEQSDDGRSWALAKIWVDADNRIVAPNKGKLLVGNARWMFKNQPESLDRDENPVVVPKRNRIVLSDLQGEEHVLIGSPEDVRKWMRDEERGDSVRFVPGKYMMGRAFATFWPANPFAWFRIGLIR